MIDQTDRLPLRFPPPLLPFPSYRLTLRYEKSATRRSTDIHEATNWTDFLRVRFLNFRGHGDASERKVDRLDSNPAAPEIEERNSPVVERPLIEAVARLRIFPR